MRKMRMILLGALATAALLSAIPSSPASAAECQKEARLVFALCHNKTLVITSNEILVLIKIGKAIFASPSLDLECEKVKNSEGEVSSPSVGKTEVKKLVLEFSACGVAKPAHCKVAEPVKTEKLKGNILKKEEIEFIPESGNIFASLSLSNNGGTCILSGTFKVTGSPSGKGQACKMPEIEVNQVEHAFSCATSGSHLKLGEETATFEGSFVDSLTEGGSWSIIEGT